MAARNRTWISFLVGLQFHSSLHIVELTLLSYRIRVARSDLGITIAPPDIHPPIVCLMSCARI
jgi:hypothetical protein